MPAMSVIIPTYNHFECLKPCCESIIKNTVLDSSIEILVVANGCTDETQEYIKNLGGSFKLIDCPKPLGYPKAINEGLKVSTGDYIILLNNDTILMNQEKSKWIYLLEEPFFLTDNCGITGPIKRHIPDINEDFMIFFCVMISRKVFMTLGYLDETFYPGSGEDIDYSIRAVRNGFKLVQVPDSTELSNSDGHMVGSFPIYHAGEKTVHDIPNWPEIFNKNMNTVYNRYRKETT